MGEHVYEVDDYHIQVVVFQLIILVKKFVGSHGVVDLMIAEGVVATISVELSLYEGRLVEVLAFFLFLVYPQVWKHLGYLVWHQSTEDGIACILGGSGETSKIGSDAANLTRALKGDSKMQGDWGEMVLETILENSGLRKDEEFFIQENTKDEEGKNFRPDVIVRFPEGRSVVIDSKVSLTAYSDAIAAEDDGERERLMKLHAASVRSHIDELAEKDYSTLVDDAIGFVLMFIPNETSYIAAMKQQPELSRYAYQKKIIIISPSNLLMALQLAYNLWQYDRKNKNVEKIVKTAADLYDKVAGFEDTFMGVGDLITRLSGTFDKAKKQLYDGAGNVMRRVESLKKLGVTPKKQIKELSDE